MGVQGAQPKRIGVLSEGPPPSDLEAVERKFWTQMKQRGWVLGENVLVERTFANWNADRLPALAQELLSKNVDVIISVAGQDAMVAAARATRSIPIVFFDAAVPVERGMIESFPRPGRNLTGVSIVSESEYVIKRLEFLRAAAPSARRLCWLWGHDTLWMSKVDGGRYAFAASLAEVARKLEFETQFFLIRGPDDLAKAFQDAATWQAQALTASGRHVGELGQKIVQLALRHRIPSAFNSADYVQEGGLVSYGIPESEIHVMEETMVSYVDRMLRGARPADLPVVGPSRYELAINLKTAQSLGLTIPQSMLVRADKLFR
jgi:putative ABC transport system substrate-binding protein